MAFSRFLSFLMQRRIPSETKLEKVFEVYYERMNFDTGYLVSVLKFTNIIVIEFGIKRINLILKVYDSFYTFGANLLYVI